MTNTIFLRAAFTRFKYFKRVRCPDLEASVRNHKPGEDAESGLSEGEVKGEYVNLSLHLNVVVLP